MAERGKKQQNAIFEFKFHVKTFQTNEVIMVFFHFPMRFYAIYKINTHQHVLLIPGETPTVDPVIFEDIDESLIAKAAIKTKGAAGSSGLDSEGWRRLLISRNYGVIGKDLRTAIAEMAKNLCTHKVEITNRKTYLEANTASKLIPLDKNPGVRPIGIGEVLRRIIGKALISTIKPEIMKSAGSLQLCAGQEAGCEAATHAMNQIFLEDETDALLLVDDSNAFNSINRKVMLHNISNTYVPQWQHMLTIVIVHRPDYLFKEEKK